jgi:hypothetical protein
MNRTSQGCKCRRKRDTESKFRAQKSLLDFEQALVGLTSQMLTALAGNNLVE